jgi:hypothetical protein
MMARGLLPRRNIGWREEFFPPHRFFFRCETFLFNMNTRAYMCGGS